MSYRCQKCRKQVNGPSNRVVTQTRHVTYKGPTEKPIDGTETVKELNLCKECAAKAGPPTKVNLGCETTL